MRLVKLVDKTGYEWRVNPERVECLKSLESPKLTRVVIAGAGGLEITVDMPIAEVAELLTAENPVEVVAEPVALKVYCRNCEQPQESHKPNWNGGLNCPMQVTYFEPTIGI